MGKRIISKAEPTACPEESEFAVGRLVSYYDEGWRAATVVDTDIDDDGELLVEVKPIVKRGRRATQIFKSKDLKPA